MLRRSAPVSRSPRRVLMSGVRLHLIGVFRCQSECSGSSRDLDWGDRGLSATRRGHAACWRWLGTVAASGASLDPSLCRLGCLALAGLLACLLACLPACLLTCTGRGSGSGSGSGMGHGAWGRAGAGAGVGAGAGAGAGAECFDASRKRQCSGQTRECPDASRRTGVLRRPLGMILFGP